MIARRRSQRPSPKLARPIDCFVEVVNRGDTEAFLGFFPDDGGSSLGRRGAFAAARDAIQKMGDGA